MKNKQTKLTLLRAAVSAIPYAGGALDHLLFDRIEREGILHLNNKIKNIELNIGSSYEYKEIKDSFEDKIDLPIKKSSQLQLDMMNIAMLKKFIAFSFKDNEECAIVPETMIHDNNDFNDINQFQGYISACLCFLSVIRYFIGKGDWKNNSPIRELLILIGTYNKNIRLKSQKIDNISEEEKKLEDAFFNADLSDWLPMNLQMILNNFCPVSQDDKFYSSWTLFCTRLFAMLIYSKKARKTKYFKLRRIQYVILNILDSILDTFISKLDITEYFIWDFEFCLMLIDLEVANSENIEYFNLINKFLVPEAIEDIRKQENYISSFKNTREILSCIKNKDLAINISRNLYIAEKYGA